MAIIPNSLAWITERETQAAITALGELRLAGTAENLRPAREALQRFVAGHPVLLTTSCTTALELALKVLDLKPGDEVIVPDFTFVATASAIIEAGGTPVFVDSDEGTYNLSLDAVAAAITPKTRAVMPVHYNGVSCDMDALLAITKSRGIRVIEDAAHSLGALYKNRPLGTIGDFGCFSFHDTKNVVCGEGGALVINDPALVDSAEWMYEKGTNRSQFLRGEIDKYTWVSRGSSYLLSGLLAALLRAQLDRYEEIRMRRERLVSMYKDGLSQVEKEGHIRFQTVPEYATIPYHIACFTVADATKRDALLQHLRSREIGAYFHFLPLCSSPFAQKHLGTKDGQHPVSARIAASIVRLPLFPQLSDASCTYVIDCVKEFFSPGTEKPLKPENARLAIETDAPDASIVIPCYNEAPHLRRNLDEILSVLDGMHLKYEVILIDDCSTDETRVRIREYIITHPHHRIRSVFHEKNLGRGGTVTEGIRIARGQFVGFLDIDLEVHARYIPAAFIALERGQADMVLAERFYRFRLFAWKRWLMSRGYRSLVQKLLKTPSLDTEAGFKFFRREAVLPVLNCVTDQHWFWDTEITIRCLDAKLRLHVEPVLFDRDANKQSTVRAFRDSWRMLRKLLSFARERNEASRL